MVLQHARSHRHATSRDDASRPNPARILGMAGAITLNASLLMLLLVPFATPVPGPLPDIVVQVPASERIPVPPVPEEVPVTVPRQRTAPAPAQPRDVIPALPAVDPVVAEGNLPAELPALGAEEAVPSDIAPAVGPIAGVRLEYDRAPSPPYPRDALRDGLEGLVMLRILVDTDGRPLEASVQSSSGHRRLDEAARRWVLREWTFRPAMRDGVAVQAIGLVPIDFNLGR